MYIYIYIYGRFSFVTAIGAISLATPSMSTGPAMVTTPILNGILYEACSCDLIGQPCTRISIQQATTNERLPRAHTHVYVYIYIYTHMYVDICRYTHTSSQEAAEVETEIAQGRPAPTWGSDLARRWAERRPALGGESQWSSAAGAQC